MRKIFLNIKILTFGLGSLMWHTIYSQQMPMFNQYVWNRMLMNPAQSYLNEEAELFAMHRSQWSDISGGPNSQLMSLSGMLKNKKSGAGLLFTHDRIGLWDQVGGYGNYSYAVKLSEEMYLSAGVMLGGFQRSFEFERVKVKDGGDPQLMGNRINKAAFDGAGGINWHWKGLDVGLAVWQIFGSEIRYLETQQQAAYRVNKHMTANIQYSYKIVEDIGLWLRPAVMLRYVTTYGGFNLSSPLQLDGSLVVDAEKWGWIQLMYKQDYSLSVGIGIHESKRLKAGFSYDFAIFNAARSELGRTGELFISYTFKPGGRSVPQTLY